MSVGKVVPSTTVGIKSVHTVVGLEENITFFKMIELDRYIQKSKKKSGGKFWDH